MRNICLYQSQTGRVGWHLKSHICTIIPGSGNFFQCRWTDEAGSQNLIAYRLEDQVFFFHFSAQDFCGIHNCINQRFITGTTTYIPVYLEPMTYLLSGRRRIFVQKNLGGKNKARRTEATLCASMSHPCNLQRMEIIRSAESLDCGDFGVFFCFFHFYNTGTDCLSVQDNGTGTTLALAAAYLTSCKQHLFTQYFCERILFIHD